MRNKATALTAFLLAILASPLAAGAPYMGPDGKPLPFASDEEALAFLRDAEVVSRRKLSEGINRPYKLELVKDGVRAHAVFRNVDVRKPRMTTQDNVYLDFEDRYIFECAAYAMNRLLGLDNVPPCVVRPLGRHDGTFQLFIEDTMSEEKRRLQGLMAPSSIKWARQRQTQYLFDALIRNFDRNQRNLLIDKDWKLWLIDHTRSFHRSQKIDKLDSIIWCEKHLWERLKALDRETVDEHLGPFLDKSHINHLMKRHAALVEHLEKRIAEVGEEAVLYDGTEEPTMVSDREDVNELVTAITSDEIPERSPDDDREMGSGGGG